MKSRFSSFAPRPTTRCECPFSPSAAVELSFALLFSGVAFFLISRRAADGYFVESLVSAIKGNDFERLFEKYGVFVPNTQEKIQRLCTFWRCSCEASSGFRNSKQRRAKDVLSYHSSYISWEEIRIELENSSQSLIKRNFCCSDFVLLLLHRKHITEQSPCICIVNGGKSFCAEMQFLIESE